MKRIALTSALVVSLLGSALSAQAIVPTTFNSTITIGSAVPLYHGKVRSRLQSECEPDRRVILYKKVPGFDPRVGRASTDQAGRWKITPGGLKSGQAFYALVRQQRLSNGINCSPATSRVVKFVGE
ncbi:MAG: hypothetical protein H0V25_04435 [Solirubrobacterales bacterium]|nr:hypothetical protein [Solirubrobacterales bacterium]